MKKMFLLLASGTVLLSASAQNNNGTWSLLQKQKNQQQGFVQSLLKKQNERLGIQQAKPTQAKERVIAMVYAEEQDSVVYRYSDNNGSYYDFNSLSYGYPESFSSPSFPAIHPGYNMMLSDNESVMADSIIYFSNNIEEDITVASYLNDGKISSFYTVYEDQGTTIYSQNIHEYNTAGNITDVYYLNGEDLNAMDSINKIKVIYNTANTLALSDTVWEYDNFFGGWAVSVYSEYIYNTNDLLDTINLYYSNNDLIAMMVISYYADNKIKDVSQYQMSFTGTPEIVVKDSFGYDTGVDYYTFFQNSTFDSGLEEEWIRQYKFVGANGLPDSILMEIGDDISIDQQVKLRPTYTIHGNPLTFEAEIFEDGILLDTGKILFYYEAYDDDNSITDYDNYLSLEVYPNPVEEKVHVNWSGTIEKVQVVLVNNIGQNIHERSMTLHQGQNAIQLPEIAAGSYFLLIQDATGKTYGSKILKK